MTTNVIKAVQKGEPPHLPGVLYMRLDQAGGVIWNENKVLATEFEFSVAALWLNILVQDDVYHGGSMCPFGWPGVLYTLDTP